MNLAQPRVLAWSRAGRASKREERAMTTTEASPQPKRGDASEGPKPADVFVALGITCGLPKVITFRPPSRLENRGLLGSPSRGVAVDDWTLDQLKQRARDSIVGAGEE